jgi:hypothetical protein
VNPSTIDRSARHYPHAVATWIRIRSSSSSIVSTDSVRGIWSRDQLEEFAKNQGVILSLSTLGPGYRAVARSQQNTTQIMGYVEGFVRPSVRKSPLLHLEKMEVFRKMVKIVRQENPDFTGGGTVFGVGLLLAYLCLLHGQEQGCQIAEFLAIHDEDVQHKKLVKLYSATGFDVIKYVGDDLRDIPDRLVWGGCGTLLRKDIPFLLNKWTLLLERNNKNNNNNKER